MRSPYSADVQGGRKGPLPRLSNMITRAKLASLRSEGAIDGSSLRSDIDARRFSVDLKPDAYLLICNVPGTMPPACGHRSRLRNNGACVRTAFIQRHQEAYRDVKA